jgi:hypothetical protein
MTVRPPIHMDHNRQTWSQPAEFSSIIFKPDANGHTLHNLCVFRSIVITDSGGR